MVSDYEQGGLRKAEQSIPGWFFDSERPLAPIEMVPKREHATSSVHAVAAKIRSAMARCLERSR